MQYSFSFCHISDYHDEEDIIPKAFTEKSTKIVDTEESTCQVKVEPGLCCNGNCWFLRMFISEC